RGGRVEEPRLSVDTAVVGYPLLQRFGPERMERLVGHATVGLVDDGNTDDVTRGSLTASRIEPVEQSARVDHIDENDYVPPPEFLGVTPEFRSKEVVGHHYVRIFHAGLDH